MYLPLLRDIVNLICVLEGAGFVRTCKDAAGAFTLCGRLGSLIWGGIERVGASVVKGQQSRQIFKVTCVYTSPRVWHVNYRSDTEARVALG
jgi:hypothetical protein